MAHPEQQEFFRQLAIVHPEHFDGNGNILEIGSQDLNGSVRDYFKHNQNFLGLDLGMAKGVDWTIPGELVELPDQWARVCISTECFEHAATWQRILMNMIRITSEGGLLILTIAGEGRATHGTIDSDEESSPFTTSYYKNLGPDDITEKIKLGHYFRCHGFQINSEARDTYFWGIRSGNAVNTTDDGWQSPLDRLARAQGQLDQAVNRHNEMKELLKKSEDALEICEQKLATKELEAEQSRQLSEELKASNESLQQQIDGLKDSRSWKLTATLRSLKDRYEHLR
jgi:hypothetical protein